MSFPCDFPSEACDNWKTATPPVGLISEYPWEYTASQWRNMGGDSEEHKEAVISALQNGIRVSEDVWREYEEGGWLEGINGF